MSDISEQEKKRLESLKELAVLDSPPDPAIERIARLVELCFDCDTVLVSMVDECRQWFKHKSGVIDVDETPREWAFCDYTVKVADLFEVTDAQSDPRFSENPLVTGSPSIRYYAGAPIRLNDGTIPGTLCLIDTKVRSPLTEKQREMLNEFAALVARELEMNSTLRRALAQFAAGGI